MRKYFLAVGIALAIGGIVAINMSINTQKNNSFSLLSLANIEVLAAEGEDDGGIGLVGYITYQQSCTVTINNISYAGYKTSCYYLGGPTVCLSTPCRRHPQ